MPTGLSKDGRLVRSNEDIVQYFGDSLLEREARGHLAINSMIVQNDRILSYGSHFCVAEIFRRKSGVPYMVMLNGDSWAPSRWISTSDHQAAVKRIVELYREQVGYDVFTVPFSAIDAAGIERGSIKPLEVRGDRWETIPHTSTKRPGPLAKMDHPDGVTEMVSETRYGHMVDGVIVESYTAGSTYGPYVVGVEKPVRVDDPNHATVEHVGQHEHGDGYAELQSDGTWTWETRRHWLGDSIFRAKSKEVRQRALTADERTLWDAYTEFMYLASEMNEMHRASFVPGEGYAEWMHRAYRDLQDHARNIQARLPHTATHRGVSFTVERWASYLSSFDYGEPHRPYFLCELPNGCKATTVDEGVAALMPTMVKLHVDLGDAVLRQGDIFAIPTTLTTDELESRAREARATRWVDQTGVRQAFDVAIRRRNAQEMYEPGDLDILGTNHQATHVIVTEDGRWFGRGKLVHAPSNRDPDHRAVKLDKDVWYEFVKNTVPTSKTRSNQRTVHVGNRRVDQSGQSRAWMLGGAVD